MRLPDGWLFTPRQDEKDRTKIVVEKTEIVRCRTCKHWDTSSDGRYYGGWCFCNKLQFSTSPDWYCAGGVREDDGNAAD